MNYAMNHAQMEAFQYLLHCANSNSILADYEFNKDLVFSYKGKLFTGSFYKEGTESGNILTVEKKFDETGYVYWDADIPSENHLLTHVEQGSDKFDEFLDFLDNINFKDDLLFETLFQEIYDFVNTLDGNPVTPFLYDLKEYRTGITLPFVRVAENAAFEPITLIDKNN